MDWASLAETILDDIGRDSLADGTTRILSDSRAVSPGDVFVAVPGALHDGHDFIEQAVAQGARYIIAERKPALPPNVKLKLVEDSAAILGHLAQAAHHWPARTLKVLGVTGTNGKTTVAYLTRAMLEAHHLRTGLLGTVVYDLGGDTVEEASNTTPGAVQLADYLATMRTNGLNAAVMECSSHGLDQRRTEGIDFIAAAFTNLTGDHLDYHVTREAYLAAKGRLFQQLPPHAIAILNGEDEASIALAEWTKARVLRYGIDNGDGRTYDITAEIVEMDLNGSVLRMTLGHDRLHFNTSLVGRHNISNLLAAAGLALAAGVDLQAIVDAAETFKGVPGRLERVQTDKPFTVLVDYAHTDDALMNVLQAVRDLKPKRLILVFGCGGDRDRTKRPRMAQVAEKLADIIVLTNDNPRNEDPHQIFADIHAGFTPDALAKLNQIEDRRQAIAHAVSLAQPGDAVLITGKGHETYQLIKGKRFDFDDCRVARQALQQL